MFRHFLFGIFCDGFNRYQWTAAARDSMMKSSGTNEFWQLYRELPKPNQRGGPPNPSFVEGKSARSGVHFKRVQDVYAVRIAKTGYRAIAVDVADGFLWIWIGSHDEYERLLRGP